MHRKEGIERHLAKRRRVLNLYRRNSVSGLLYDEKRPAFTLPRCRTEQQDHLRWHKRPAVSEVSFARTVVLFQNKK